MRLPRRDDSRSFGREIDPEDIFLDAMNPGEFDTDRLEGRIESSIGGAPILLGLLIVTAGLLTLAARAGFLQIVRGSDLKRLAEENRVFSVTLPAPRGIFYDRNREALVKNTPSFEVVLHRNEVPDDEPARRELLRAIAGFFSVPPEDLLLLGFDPALPKEKLPAEITVASDVSRETVLQLESEREKFPGLVVRERSLRDYPKGPAFFHLLGYVGKVTDEDLQAGYRPFDLTGKGGLESYYEHDLKGEAGEKLVEVNSANSRLRDLPEQDPTIGKSFVLNIDAGLQAVLYRSLKNELEAQGKTAGSAVALDPRDGAVRALVSLPSIDPNVFRGRISNADFERLFLNRAKPFFNRAVAGEYPSGSVIKPMMAVAALEERVIDPNLKIWDPGYIDVPNPYSPGNSTRFPDWREQGWIDMRGALQWSANVYFYIIGGGFKDIKGLGITKIGEYMKKFGFGSPLGIDLPGEKAGLIPGPAVLEKARPRDQIWRLGDTYHASIGQGFFQATPLQIAAMTAAVVNGGTLWKPEVVREILDENGSVMETIKPEALREHLGSPESFKIAREGMRLVVTAGTGHAILGSLPIAIAGKSGTAQTGFEQNTHGWFTAFAPFDDPELVTVVMAEDVKANTGIATRVTRDIMWWYFVERNRAPAPAAATSTAP